LDESDEVPKDIEHAFGIPASREDLGVEFVEVRERIWVTTLRDVENDLELLGGFIIWVVDELENGGRVDELTRTTGYDFLDREFGWPGFRNGGHRMGVNWVPVDILETGAQNVANIFFRILTIVEVYRPAFVATQRSVEVGDDTRFWSAGDDETEREARLLECKEDELEDIQLLFLRQTFVQSINDDNTLRSGFAGKTNLGKWLQNQLLQLDFHRLGDDCRVRLDDFLDFVLESWDIDSQLVSESGEQSLASVTISRVA